VEEGWRVGIQNFVSRVFNPFGNIRVGLVFGLGSG